ncbi:MAG: dephospho-CoA kinase, partial [Pelagibacteraceae bacterium]
NEIPLLYEEKLYNFYDKVIFIKSDCNKRLHRVMKRGVSKDYFYLMNKRQMNQNIKSIQSDFTILNNGSKLDLYNQTQRLIEVCEK